MATTTETVRRVDAIDVFRGVLVVLLVFIEYLPPAAGEPYRWLRHSPWDGVRIADFVFPGFLFVVGASLAVSRSPSVSRAARRAVTLVVVGLLFNAWGDSGTDLSELRMTGVLQTIGIAGLLATVVVLAAREPVRAAGVAVVLLVVHATLVDDAFAIDQALVPDAHLYRDGALDHDPEGVLATVLGATAVVLGGWVVARLRDQLRAMTMFVGASAALLVASWFVWAPNKRQWTPTFSLLMVLTGALVLLALLRAPTTVPVLGAIGRNALLVYVGQHVVRAALEQTPHGDTTLAGAAARALGDGPRALLAYAAIATVAWSAAAIGLGRAGYRLRV